MEPAAVVWGEGEGENPSAVGHRRKTWFAMARLEIWELKSWELRGSCESQSGCKRGIVTCEEQKPLPLRDPAASAPAALAQVMPSLPTHTPDGSCTPHCMVVLPKGSQCSVVGHVPPLLLWALLELARSRMVQARPWLQRGASSVPLSCRGKLPVSGGQELRGGWGQLYPLTLP